MSLEAAELAEMSEDVASQSDPVRAADHVIRRAQWIFGADGVTLLVQRGKQPIVAANPEGLCRAVGLQLTTNQGPCLAASQDGHLHISEDISTDPRWPTWGRQVAQLGCRTCLSTPLRFGSRTLGALTLYSRKPVLFDQAFVDAVNVFAVQAATTLSLVMQAAQLQDAIGSRHLIGQAQGILMQQRGINADEAYQLMKARSQNCNIKVHTIAMSVVDIGRMPQPDQILPVQPTGEVQPPDDADSAEDDADDDASARQISRPKASR